MYPRPSPEILTLNLRNNLHLTLISETHAGVLNAFQMMDSGASEENEATKDVFQMMINGASEENDAMRDVFQMMINRSSEENKGISQRDLALHLDIEHVGHVEHADVTESDGHY